MAILSCIVKKPPDGDRKSFFEKVQELGIQVKSLKSVYRVNTADELTFIEEAALVRFLELAPKEWNVTSEYKSETLVTLAPLTGHGHALVDDSVVVFALTQRCNVLSGKRGYYREYPEIEDGRRLFRVKDIKSLGSSLRFGSAVFSVSYKGQTSTCHKCGSKEHLAKDCDVGKRCFRCGSPDHEVRDCESGIKCDACQEVGHPFFKCPNSYANKVKMTSNWTSFDHETTDRECFEAAAAVSRPESTSSEIDRSLDRSSDIPLDITPLDPKELNRPELTQLNLGTLQDPDGPGGGFIDDIAPAQTNEADTSPVLDNTEDNAKNSKGVLTRQQNKTNVSAPKPASSSKKNSGPRANGVVKNSKVPPK